MYAFRILHLLTAHQSTVLVTCSVINQGETNNVALHV